MSFEKNIYKVNIMSQKCLLMPQEFPDNVTTTMTSRKLQNDFQNFCIESKIN